MKAVQVIKNNKLLVITFIIYITLYITMPEKAYSSLNKSFYYIKELLQIIPVVFILTSIIEAWVPKDMIMKSFDGSSGIRGNMLSFLLGSVSAGQIYAAFPVCKMLLRNGVSISNAVIILSSWAVIKIPMLANEAKFLGIKFMGFRWVLTVLSVFAIGYGVQALVRKDSIPLDREINQYGAESVVIEELSCVGCGLCARLLPGHFEIRDRKSKLKNADVGNTDSGIYKEIILKCPVKAISLTQEIN